MRDKKNISGTELEKFSHFYRGRVQFSEVDSFGVTHNLIYCYWLEWARTDYLRSIGIKMNPRTFLKEHSLMTVHSEIDYFSSSSFNDEYEVLSRIDWVKNSSLCFVNYIRLVKNNKILTRASSVLVNVDPQTGDSIPIGDDLRKMIKKFEQDNVKFIK
jgi:YbgC/YbaW family acyl-CoA thioester hydrolase